MIDEFVKLIPEELMNMSGAAFYSGRNAFQGQKDLYILGFNPGGSDINLRTTVIKHTDKVLAITTPNWSEYKDESWGENRPAGTHGLQPRILHLLKELNISPYDVPSSNVCFVRSKVIKDFTKKQRNLYLELCWLFHYKVIQELRIKVILCFGKAAGSFVCKKLNANTHVDTFIELNKRKWESTVYKNDRGQIVIVATHPSRADWTNPDSDPSGLVKKHLEKWSTN